MTDVVSNTIPATVSSASHSASSSHVTTAVPLPMRRSGPEAALGRLRAWSHRSPTGELAPAPRCWIRPAWTSACRPNGKVRLEQDANSPSVFRLSMLGLSSCIYQKENMNKLRFINTNCWIQLKVYKNAFQAYIRVGLLVTYSYTVA